MLVAVSWMALISLDGLDTTCRSVGPERDGRSADPTIPYTKIRDHFTPLPVPPLPLPGSPPSALNLLMGP